MCVRDASCHVLTPLCREWTIGLRSFVGWNAFLLSRRRSCAFTKWNYNICEFKLFCENRKEVEMRQSSHHVSITGHLPERFVSRLDIRRKRKKKVFNERKRRQKIKFLRSPIAGCKRPKSTFSTTKRQLMVFERNIKKNWKMATVFQPTDRILTWKQKKRK